MRWWGGRPHAACDILTRNVLQSFFTTLRVLGDAFTVCVQTGCRRQTDTLLQSISRCVKARLATKYDLSLTNVSKRNTSNLYPCTGYAQTTKLNELNTSSVMGNPLCRHHSTAKPSCQFLRLYFPSLLSLHKYLFVTSAVVLDHSILKVRATLLRLKVVAIQKVSNPYLTERNTTKQLVAESHLVCGPA